MDPELEPLPLESLSYRLNVFVSDVLCRIIIWKMSVHCPVFASTLGGGVSVVPSELSQFWIFSCFINKLQRIAYVGRTEPGTNWNQCTEEKSTLQCHRWTLQASHATLDPIHSLVNKVIELLSLHVWLVMSTWLMAVLCTWAGQCCCTLCEFCWCVTRSAFLFWNNAACLFY